MNSQYSFSFEAVGTSTFIPSSGNFSGSALEKKPTPGKGKMPDLSFELAKKALRQNLNPFLVSEGSNL